MENARRAAFSFFPMRSGGCAPEAFVVAKQPSAALSLQEGHFVTWPAVRLRHSEKLRCFYLDAARTRLEKTSASLPLWARIPRVYIWNNELKRAKDAIFERPLKTPVLFVCIVLVIFSASFFFCPLFAAVFPRSDFFLLSNECVLKCSEVQYFPQNILK